MYENKARGLALKKVLRESCDSKDFLCGHFLYLDWWKHVFSNFYYVISQREKKSNILLNPFFNFFIPNIRKNITHQNLGWISLYESRQVSWQDFSLPSFWRKVFPRRWSQNLSSIEFLQYSFKILNFSTSFQWFQWNTSFVLENVF